MRLLSNITFVIAVVAAAGCGSKGPPFQPPSPPQQLQMSCPAAITRNASSPQGTDVHFDAPTPTGGRAPYNVQCQPGSGSTFAIGETAVGCTATDLDMKQVLCGFGITVRVTQTLAKTTFTAFGDSITEGAISLAPLVMLDGPETYPFKLEQMLRERYPTQSVLVINRGKGSDQTNQGVVRLPSVLDADQPEVMLLLEGINGIRIPSLTPARQERHLQTMISEAHRRGIDVIIATVMPVAPNGRFQPAAEYMTLIRELNTRIVGLTNANRLGPVVDLFALFESNMHLLGIDGVHPTAEGQTRIAEAFRDEVVRRYGSDANTSLYTDVRPMR